MQRYAPVTVTIAGEAYVMVLTSPAIVRLEQAFAMHFDNILREAAGGSVQHTVGVVWAALTTHHPEITLERAAALVDAGGGLIAFADRVMAAGLATRGTHGE